MLSNRLLLKSKFGQQCLISFNFRRMSITGVISSLRKDTGSPLHECKQALEEAGGDIEKAKQWLRDRGVAVADK